MGWVVGPITTIGALMRGATLVCYDGAPDASGWDRYFRLIDKHRVTHYGASPTLIRALASNTAENRARELASLRILITAGEVIDPEHFAWFSQAFGGGRCPVINYTGGTEVSGALLANVVLEPIFPSSFNAVSPAIELDVLGEDGRPLADQVGELVIRKPFVGMTLPFWNDRERYIETYWSRWPDLWVHGDLALRRKDGVFFLLGRSDDTLKIAGKRLGPAEVEAIILEHPEVAEAAAIGIADPLKGQKLVVFVVAASAVAAPQLEAELGARIDARLGKPFRPDRVHVVPQLPKTRNAKVMRRVLRRVYLGEPPGDVSALENPAALDAIRAATPTA
jgi:acetyl-CoA synthetase